MRKIVSLFIMFAIAACAVTLPFMATNNVAPGGSTILEIGLGSTVYGVMRSLEGYPGTRILISPERDIVLFTWALEDGVAFVAMNAKKALPIQDFLERAGGRGNFTNIKTAQHLGKYLCDNGWKVVTAAELPAAFKVALSTSIKTALDAAQVWTTYIVVPAGAFESVEALKAYEEVQG